MGSDQSSNAASLRCNGVACRCRMPSVQWWRGEKRCTGTGNGSCHARRRMKLTLPVPCRIDHA